jgi:hypothetical protein
MGKVCSTDGAKKFILEKSRRKETCRKNLT